MPALYVPALLRLSDFPGADHPLTFQGWVMWIFPFICQCLQYSSGFPCCIIFPKSPHPGQEPCLILCLADHKKLLVLHQCKRILAELLLCSCVFWLDLKSFSFMSLGPFLEPSELSWKLFRPPQQRAVKIRLTKWLLGSWWKMFTVVLGWNGGWGGRFGLYLGLCCHQHAASSSVPSMTKKEAGIWDL